MPANLPFANLSVAPKMISKKNNVSTNSAIKADDKEYPSGENAPKPLDAKAPALVLSIAKPAFPEAIV